MHSASEACICPICHGPHPEEDCAVLLEMEEADGAFEAMTELSYRGDYPGLVAYCVARAAHRPDDASCLYYLGEAYVLNGQYGQALEILKGLHRLKPDDADVQHRILDALFGMGKDEAHFDWLEDPEVNRLTAAVVEACYGYLKPKRKARSVWDLYAHVGSGCYCAFSENDLLEALRQDGRFTVDMDADIHVRRPGRSRRRARR